MRSNIVQSFKSVLRTYMLRMESLSQESSKFSLMHPLEDLDTSFSRLLHGNDIKQSLVLELTNVQIKSDQHCLLIMTLLGDLSKWVIDNTTDSLFCLGRNIIDQLSELMDSGLQMSLIQCIINQSFVLLKHQKKHQTLISKNHELIRTLIQLIPAFLPIAIYKSKTQSKGGDKNRKLENFLFQQYVKLFQMLTEVRDFYPQPNKDEIKKSFNKSVENSLNMFRNLITIFSMQISSQAQKYQNRTFFYHIIEQVMRYIEFIYGKQKQDIYKLIDIFNCISLANPTPSNLNLNLTIVPTQQLFSLFPEVFNLYSGNYSEILISRMRILKEIIDFLQLFNKIYELSENKFKLSPEKLHFKNNHSNLTQKMKYHEEILHTASHTLIQINGFVKTNNYYLIGLVFSIYEKIIVLLLKRESMVPLYLYTHLIFGNLKFIVQNNHPSELSPINNENGQKKYLLLIPNLHIHCLPYINSQSQSTSSTGRSFQLVLLETVLTEISNLFEIQKLTYFLRLYDWNFMQQNICLNSIKYLYQFIENTDNEKFPEYQLFKKCLGVINRRIQTFLESGSKQNEEQKIIQTTVRQPNRQRKQFYELKKKQYLSLVEKINKKPKDIFKVIKEMSSDDHSQQAKEDYIQKCVRIVKKSNHVDQKMMIDLMANTAPESNEILEKYLQTFFKQKKNSSSNSNVKSHNLENLLRFIISNFFLAGEGQQIVRFIDKVTTEYFKYQPKQKTLFKNSDSVYTFANAIILLNSDQHNPRNPNRMTVQSFSKMCEKINGGEDLPAQIIRETFKNIKQTQIHTFRNRYSMQKISLECWLNTVNQYESVSLGYYDHDMSEIYGQGCSNLAFRQFANQLLLSVIDQKETQKLELMISRFEYDDKKFECEIIQKVRGMIVNKNHIAMHALQKIYQEADFKNRKIDEKMISYCWLAYGLIDNFSDALPFSKISQYLLRTWRVNYQLKDNLMIRQNLELKTIKKCLKEYKKKQSKKSIMDMFSKFLSSKDSQNSQEELASEVHSSGNSLNPKKRANITNSSFNILKLLMKSKDSRTRAAETILLSLRHQESRRFEQFVTCLYLIFHLVYGDLQGQGEQQNPISNDCISILVNLIQDFFCLVEPHQIGSRIVSLKSKKVEMYDLVYSYTQFWTMKILLNWSTFNLNKEKNKETTSPVSQDRLDRIYRKCEDFLPKCNSDLSIQFFSIIDVDTLNFCTLTQKLGLPETMVKILRQLSECHKIKLVHLIKEVDEMKVEEVVSESQKKTVQDKSDIDLDKVSTQVLKEQKMQSQRQTEIDRVQQNTKTTDLKQNIFLQGDMAELSFQNNQQIIDDIQQRIKQQLGIDSTKPSNQFDAHSQSKKENGSQKLQSPLIKQNIIKQEEKDDKKSSKSAKSSQNSQQIGTPVYML